MTPATVVPFLLVPLILWRVYARVKRLMTRQKSQAWRHWIAAVLFPLALAGMAFAGLSNPNALIALATGTMAGATLGVFGLQKTKFENVDGVLYYTPNAHIGMLVSLIFIGRLLFRMIQVYTGAALPNEPMGQSPLTMAAFGVMAGYYLVYAAGLLAWRRKELRQ